MASVPASFIFCKQVCASITSPFVDERLLSVGGAARGAAGGRGVSRAAGRGRGGLGVSRAAGGGGIGAATRGGGLGVSGATSSAAGGCGVGGAACGESSDLLEVLGHDGSSQRDAPGGAASICARVFAQNYLLKSRAHAKEGTNLLVGYQKVSRCIFVKCLR